MSFRPFWPGQTFSHALRLDPRDPVSVRWNPLAEIRPGSGELAQVQRLVAILSDPGGARDDEAIWDKAASEILEAVILHVLYTAEDGQKSLIKVRELLADLDGTAEVMRRTLHRAGADGALETHPFIRTAVTGYASMHDRFRTSVQGTARSYLKWLVGEDLERVLSTSDFALGDLMCADAPMSLYVQITPADAVALRPFVRLLFYAAAQALTADEEHDAFGRMKRRPLLMLMDEFPLLGRLAFFEKALRLLSGYGVKTLFVAQSLNDIVETYGAHNTILDNCAVYTAFSALDPLTQEKVSRLTGTVTETRKSRSGPAGLAAGRASVSHGEVEHPLLEPGEVRALPDDTQVVFVAGHKPLCAQKLQYDRSEPFRRRARFSAPVQSLRLDAPKQPLHPWAGRRSLGVDPEAELPLFKEVAAAIDDKKAAAQAAQAYGRVYLNDPKIVTGLNREARAGRMPLSQAAGRAIARGLQHNPRADPDDRLETLERSLRDHMRSTARDMQIVQELLVEVARAFFLRLPDAVIDEDPTVQAAVDRRIEKLLDATAARIVAGRNPARRDEPRSLDAASS
ncbi:hypothetical protein LTR94_023607 [Friedmanniomyces endolithicus]|nr:hypothetical protein LTR94_023607 [Friedmanniomyces endolithicus]